MKLTCYHFDYIGEERGYGYVYAKNEEEAREKILNQHYEDILDTYDHTIKEITNISEDKDDTIEVEE